MKDTAPNACLIEPAGALSVSDNFDHMQAIANTQKFYRLVTGGA